MFVIQFVGLVVEAVEEVDGRPQPIWGPTHERAMRFDTYEDAEEVWFQHQDNMTMSQAEIVEVEA